MPLSYEFNTEYTSLYKSAMRKRTKSYILRICQCQSVVISSKARKIMQMDEKSKRMKKSIIGKVISGENESKRINYSIGYVCKVS